MIKIIFLRSVILFLFGLFGVLSFSPYNFWIASIISMTGLMIHIINLTWKQSIWYTLCWSVGFFGGGLYWIYFGILEFNTIYNYIKIIFLIFLVLYLALFPILFAVVLILLKSTTMTWDIVIYSPILWSITECFRGYMFGGFPWLQFGYSQIDGPLKGIAPIFGIEAITFVLILISALLTVAIKTIQLVPIFIAISILLIIWPLKWIKWCYLQPQRAVQVSLIQGNILQNIKYDANYVKIILNKYLQYTLPIIGKTKLIIWPESAILENETDCSVFLTKLDRKLRYYQTNLITGIIGTCDFNKNYYYNSIIVLGELTPYNILNCNRYNKHHLVLFSESIPLNFFSRFLIKIFDIPQPYMQHGNYLQPQLIASNIKITAAICYEIIFGHQLRDNFKFDTDFLLTIANDAWFGDSIGPWQHFQMTRMRALELNRPLLCVTNNGITAIINYDGSIKKKFPQFISGVLNADVIPTTGVTPYAKYGYHLFWNYFILYPCFIILIIKYRNIYNVNSLQMISNIYK